MKERVRDSGKIIVLIALMLFLLSGCGGDSVDDKYEKTGKYLKEMTEETSPSVNSVGGEWGSNRPRPLGNRSVRRS